ncbi:NUDIX hydrolase [Candidatus Gracilibacteria bacterium]|nr:NUDIX hydrolase [Candidatus Gracilibacteria bacterium]
MRQVVRILLKNDEGKYLLVKHSKSEMWTIPGGHIEGSETLQQAIKRELKEEFNFKIQLIGQKDDFEIEHIKELVLPISNYKIYYDSKKFGKVKKQEYIFHGRVKNIEEIMVQESEIQDYKWCTPEQILETENIYPQIPLLLKKLIS